MELTTDGDDTSSSAQKSTIVGGSESESVVDAGLVSLVAIALCLVAVNLWLVLAYGDRLFVTLAKLLAPGSVVLITVFAVWWSHQSGYEQSLGHVSLWATAGTVVFGLSGLAEQLLQHAQGVLLELTPAPVFSWACGGFVVGATVGLYSARLRTQRAQTERARRQAEQLAEAQTVLNRVLRHDIRNNVNIVEGYVDLVAAEDADPEHVETIHEHTARIVSLAEYAREIERLVSQRGAGVESIDLVERLTAIRSDILEEYPDARVVTDFPDRMMVCAHDLIDSAFENLLENAIEHHPGEQPEVRMSVARDEGDDGDEVVVTIADDGAGIPDAEVSVFESGDESRLEHSSGMGLWLVKWIVAYSDGELDFVRNDVSGSEIAIRLPTKESGRDVAT